MASVGVSADPLPLISVRLGSQHDSAQQSLVWHLHTSLIHSLGKHSERASLAVHALQQGSDFSSLELIFITSFVISKVTPSPDCGITHLPHWSQGGTPGGAGGWGRGPPVFSQDLLEDLGWSQGGVSVISEARTWH